MECNHTNTEHIPHEDVVHWRCKDCGEVFLSYKQYEDDVKRYNEAHKADHGDDEARSAKGE